MRRSTTHVTHWKGWSMKWPNPFSRTGHASPLLAFLKTRRLQPSLPPEDFSLLLAEARACGLLGHVAHRLHRETAAPDAAEVPHDFLPQVRGASVQARAFRSDVLRELSFLQAALSKLPSPVLLLKGAAYVLLDLPPANGRQFSDIDVLVPSPHLAEAESALMLRGWSTGRLDAYDARYYREWSHEVPPMTHIQRGTTVDLHHALAMPTCRQPIDSNRMIADAIPVHGSDFWWRLRDEDMVLHAAAHLLLNSEFDHALRDLSDIDLLYRHFSDGNPDFGPQLCARARNVGLENILQQAAHLARTLFDTPFPEATGCSARNAPVVWLLSRAATTRHPLTRPFGQQPADAILMLREMYLRLPNRLLAVHLRHKLNTLMPWRKTETPERAG